MTASPHQHALAALCGFGSSVALGWMPHMLLWLGIIYGYLVGEATLRGGGRRRGPLMQVIAGTAAAVGFTAWGMIRGYPLVITQFVNPWDLIGLGLGVFFAVMRVRYI